MPLSRLTLKGRGYMFASALDGDCDNAQPILDGDGDGDGDGAGPRPISSPASPAQKKPT